MDEASIKSMFAQMENRLAASISASVLSGISNQLSNLETKLTTLEETVAANSKKSNCNAIASHAAKTLATSASNDIKDLRTEMDVLSVSTSNLDQFKDTVNSFNAKQATINHVLLEKAEDLTNRSLRKTVIIRGIPEERGEVSWDDTRKVVVNALVKYTGRSYDDLNSVFERIHRATKKESTNNQQNRSTQPRIIHALLRDWNEIEKLSTALRKSEEQNGIYIDQQYGPLTTYRRSQALLKRKTMKEANTITGGHVKYPAVLFVRYSHGEKFVRCEDFSKLPIPDDVLLKII